MMLLRDLLPDFVLPELLAERVIAGVELDSRKLAQDYVFIALSGAKFNGRDFIPAACQAQVAAVLVEGARFAIEWQEQTAIIVLPQLRENTSLIAARFYHQPSETLRVTGITGTNGKTSCSLLLAQLSAQLLGTSSVMGTTGYGVLDAKSLTPLAEQIALLQTTGLTTPDPISVQKILANLRDQGAVYSAIEVSSHSLDQHRVAGVQFHTAIFTNLTQDHLDYHGTMAAYGEAKAQLLQALDLQIAVINLNDTWAASLVEQVPVNVTRFTYAICDADKTMTADVYAKNLQQHARGLHADLVTPWGEGRLESPFFGRFNLSNLLAVITAACAQGADFHLVLKLVPQLVAAPGRLQAVNIDAAQDVQVLVDYAHTPDALENTLKAIHEHEAGRIWCVFGCGGERDTTKRPLMGRIAERLSQYVIVTNDNPRGEDPAVIAADIVKGLHNPQGCLVIADRAQAIDFAIAQAKSEDIILIAGKGHEDYQIFADKTLPFSDAQHARLSLQRRLSKRDATQAQGARGDAQ